MVVQSVTRLRCVPGCVWWPAVTPDLAGRLSDLQRELNSVAPGGIPAVLSVLLFQDDNPMDFRRYTDELETWCRERGAGDTILVEIVQLAPH